VKRTWPSVEKGQKETHALQNEKTASRRLSEIQSCVLIKGGASSTLVVLESQEAGRFGHVLGP
jgi:hypothetical protein